MAEPSGERRSLRSHCPTHRVTPELVGQVHETRSGSFPGCVQFSIVGGAQFSVAIAERPWVRLLLLLEFTTGAVPLD